MVDFRSCNCSCWLASRTSVSCNCDRNCEFRFSTASVSFRAAATIVLASSNSAEVKFSSSPSVCFLAFSAFSRSARACAISARNDDMVFSISLFFTSTPCVMASSRLRFSARTLASSCRACSSSDRVACSVSSRFVL